MDRINSDSLSLSSNVGMTLVEVMVAIGISGIVLTAIMSLSNLSLKQQYQSNLTFQADLFRKNLVLLINNSDAWKNTIAATANSAPYTVGGTPYTAPPTSSATDPPGLNCLIGSGSPCTNNGKDLTASPAGTAISGMKILQILDNKGVLFYDTTSNTKGLSPQGTACNGFVAPSIPPAPPTPGNDNCPLRFDISWTAVCGTSCVNPQVQIHIQAVYNPATSSRTVAFNPANYSATFFQSGSASGSSGDFIIWY